MCGKWVVCVLIAFPIAACADPQYQNAPPYSGEPRKLSGCQARFATGACVSVSWKQQPEEGEFGAFEVQIYRRGPKGSPPVFEDPAGSLSVVLWMPSMGHGSSPVTVKRVEEGVYKVTNVYFSMRGDWEIRFFVKNGNEILDQAVVPLRF